MREIIGEEEQGRAGILIVDGDLSCDLKPKPNTSYSYRMKAGSERDKPSIYSTTRYGLCFLSLLVRI
jgi:hypothetical protein